MVESDNRPCTMAMGCSMIHTRQLVDGDGDHWALRDEAQSEANQIQNEEVENAVL